MGEYAEVIEWDVLNGDVLGALIRCPDCPCLPGSGCDGDLTVHRPYRMPSGHPIDLYRHAGILVQITDEPLAPIPQEGAG